MNEPETDIANEPQWIVKLRRTKPYAIGILIGGLVVAAGNGTDAIGKIFDRFKQPEAFVLAENTAKSAFSDQLAQRAWRRLFWADNFRARVLGHAPISDIDSSWKAYIESDAEWNANIMISIVGLEHYYGAKRSAQLEGNIQDLFRQLDEKLALLRRSDIISALRAGKLPDAKQDEGDSALVDQTDKISNLLKLKLYILVRCFDTKTGSKNLCD